MAYAGEMPIAVSYGPESSRGPKLTLCSEHLTCIGR